MCGEHGAHQGARRRGLRRPGQRRRPRPLRRWRHQAGHPQDQARGVRVRDAAAEGRRLGRALHRCRDPPGAGHRAAQTAGRAAGGPRAALDRRDPTDDGDDPRAELQPGPRGAVPSLCDRHSARRTRPATPGADGADLRQHVAVLAVRRGPVPSHLLHRHLGLPGDQDPGDATPRVAGAAGDLSRQSGEPGDGDPAPRTRGGSRSRGRVRSASDRALGSFDMTETLVSVHQPNFMPWLKLLDKILASDVYVAYDTAQFTNTEYHARQKVKTPSKPVWMSVPVLSTGDYQPIMDVEIDTKQPYGRQHLHRLRTAYGSTPYFDEVYPLMKEVYAGDHERLVDLNLDL